jgi:hypothetical protein
MNRLWQAGLSEAVVRHPVDLQLDQPEFDQLTLGKVDFEKFATVRDIVKPERTMQPKPATN